MAKKFYDIFPPHIKKEERAAKTFCPLKKKKKVLTCFGLKKMAISLVVIFLVFIIASHTVLLGATIIIWPEISEVSHSGEIIIDSSVIYPDFEKGLIPGEIFEIKEEESRTFFSSGKETEGKRAEGLLKVYNNYSVSPQSLVKNTRFISADGKLFHSTEKIIIPGKKEEGGRVIPGEAEVLVRAAESGKEYNIERTSKFSIPGLQGTALYTMVYAENQKPITGGHIGNLPLITKQDIENARNVLVLDLFNKAKSKIKKEIADDFIIENDLIEEEILEESFYPGIGENSESFEYSIKMKVKIISFKKSHFEENVENALFNEISEPEEEIQGIFSGKKIFKEGLVVNFYPERINFREGKATLKADSKVPIYLGINEENFKINLSGKKIEEFEMIMENYSEIFKFKLSYWPFWIKTIPKFDKINIEIRIKE